jgi:hypothetical protein
VLRPAGLAAPRSDVRGIAAGQIEINLHTGFGVRDLHRVYSGPAYGKHRVRAVRAGRQMRPGCSATDWAGSTSVITTSRQGRTRIEARAVLLATGCRERPRPARLIPGSRPAGVFTTGGLQQLVHLAGHRTVAASSSSVPNTSHSRLSTR